MLHACPNGNKTHHSVDCCVGVQTVARLRECRCRFVPASQWMIAFFVLLMWAAVTCCLKYIRYFGKFMNVQRLSFYRRNRYTKIHTTSWVANDPQISERSLLQILNGVGMLASRSTQLFIRRCTHHARVHSKRHCTTNAEQAAAASNKSTNRIGIRSVPPLFSALFAWVESFLCPRCCTRWGFIMGWSTLLRIPRE